MRKLFNTLRNIVERTTGERTRREQGPSAPDEGSAEQVAILDQFDSRMDVLTSYAEQALGYEDTLTNHIDRLTVELDQIRQAVEQCIDKGRDRDALEFLRLAVRLRPQLELVQGELGAFHAVADALIMKVNALVGHITEARIYANSATMNPDMPVQLNDTMTKLTRYFVMLERVTAARRDSLPERLMGQMTTIIDDRRLDVELATYVLARRRGISARNPPHHA